MKNSLVNFTIKIKCYFTLLIVLGGVGCTKHPAGPTTLVIEGFADRGAIEVSSPPTDSKPIPLIIVLHGYRSNSFLQKTYFRFENLQSPKRPFHLVYLEGSKDEAGDRFWNASPSCCNFHKASTDDVAYISQVILALKRKLQVSKVFIVGHSNGGFMAYRMLCERGDIIDGIASLAGMDSPLCGGKTFSHPMRVIHIHGTKDDVIPEVGGSFRGLAPFPSLSEMTNRLREKLQCDPAHQDIRKFDYSNAIPGEDSVRTSYSCQGENHLSVVRVLGGSHIPFLNDKFREDLLDLLLH